jgi:hypothetical protein
MNDIENQIINDEKQLIILNYLLNKYQFSEEFLIKTKKYYDSCKCIKTQKNLSPYFCFNYIYDQDDSNDDWVDYNQIYTYLKKLNYSDEIIENEFKKYLKMI